MRIPLCLGPSSRLSEELGLGVTVTSCSLLSALLLWLLGLLGVGKGDMIEQNSGPSTLGILEPWIPLPVPTCSKNQEAGRSTRPEEPTPLSWGHEGPTSVGDSRTEKGSTHLDS